MTQTHFASQTGAATPAQHTKGGHTKEPWSQHWDGEGGAFVSANGRVRADMVGPLDECKANARRIVAAVNAVEGIPTEALEAGVVADMLAALRELLEAYAEPDRQLCCNGYECGCRGASIRDQAEHYARATIARAEGRS